MKKHLLLLSIFTFTTAVFAFEWPQTEIMSDTFFTYFGQLRGGIASPSLVFSGSTDIKTAEKGTVIAVLSEQDQDSDIFESPLGNTVIVSHQDNMLSVYANLDNDFHEERLFLTDVEKGTPLGNCGNSGWQEGNALLEFQIIDTKNKAYVNPRLLMPRFGNELPLTIQNIRAINKKGQAFDLNVQKRLQSGTYYLYREKQKTAMPYKTTVLINGAMVDSITYDTLITNKGKLSTQGKNNYHTEILYPDEKRHLLAEINLPKGKNKITIVVENILGKEITITYTVDSF